MKEYQKKFIEFLAEVGVISFGSFTLKSGRIAPYFVNAGKINAGDQLSKLAQFYAEHIIENNLLPINAVFGPAYKGIPLAVATVLALNAKGITTNYCFDRKEEKSHGDKGRFVGHPLKSGDSIVLVDDVISAGTTMNAQIPMMEELGVQLKGIIVLVDRCEKGTGDVSAVQEIQSKFNVKIYPIVTVHQIVEHLSNTNSAFGLSKEKVSSINEYLQQYGA